MQSPYLATFRFPPGKREAYSLGTSRTWNLRSTGVTPYGSVSWNLFTKETGRSIKKDLVVKDCVWVEQANVVTTENFQADMEAKLAERDTLTFGILRRSKANVRPTISLLRDLEPGQAT